MSKAEKEEQRIRQNTYNVSLEDFETLILRYGQILKGGCHPKAYINHHVYSYKRQNPVDAHYVEHILALIDELKEE